MHAARGLADGNADVYPNYGIEDWLRMAKRLYRVNSSGRIVLDYDMKIAEPFRVPGNETGPDMWPTIDAMQGLPLLIVRGERSDICPAPSRSEEHTSELQSRPHLVCRLLLEKKKQIQNKRT